MDHNQIYDAWIESLRAKDKTGEADLPAAVLAVRDRQRRGVPAWAWVAAAVVCVARAAAAVLVLVVG